MITSLISARFGTHPNIRRTVSFVSTCLLIRHGRTSSNANGTLAGWTEGVGLDDIGRDQAAGLAERLRVLPIREVGSPVVQRYVQNGQIVVSALCHVTVQT